MIHFPFPVPADRPLEVLCLGAHADDIEIGCGGTVLTLLSQVEARVRWVVFSGDGVRAAEADVSAKKFLISATDSTVTTHDFRDAHMPSARSDLKDTLASIATEYADKPGPDLIFTHEEGDLHQDHALLGALTREAFRDHLILGYEIPKVDGGLTTPNVLVAISEAVAHEKAGLVAGGFPSQASKAWFSPETFLSLMRVRGVEAASPTGFAEGFHVRKVVLGG